MIMIVQILHFTVVMIILIVMIVVSVVMIITDFAFLVMVVFFIIIMRFSTHYLYPIWYVYIHDISICKTSKDVLMRYLLLGILWSQSHATAMTIMTMPSSAKCVWFKSFLARLGCFGRHDVSCRFLDNQGQTQQPRSRYYWACLNLCTFDLTKRKSFDNLLSDLLQN